MIEKIVVAAFIIFIIIVFVIFFKFRNKKTKEKIEEEKTNRMRDLDRAISNDLKKR